VSHCLAPLEERSRPHPREQGPCLPPSLLTLTSPHPPRLQDGITPLTLARRCQNSNCETFIRGYMVRPPPPPLSPLVTTLSLPPCPPCPACSTIIRGGSVGCRSIIRSVTSLCPALPPSPPSWPLQTWDGTSPSCSKPRPLALSGSITNGPLLSHSVLCTAFGWPHRVGRGEQRRGGGSD
jgi:hypothetical protein